MQRISIKYMYTNPPNSKYFKVLYGRRRNEADDVDDGQKQQQQKKKQQRHQMKNGSKVYGNQNRVIS